MRWLKLLAVLIMCSLGSLAAQTVDTALVGSWKAVTPVINLYRAQPSSMSAYITFESSGTFESHLEVRERTDSNTVESSALPPVRGVWGAISGPWDSPMLCVKRDNMVVGGVLESKSPHCQPYRIENEKLIWNGIEFNRYRETSTDL